MRKFITLSSLIFCSIFCFGQSGSLDPSFGSNGFVKSSVGRSFDYNSAGRQVLTGTNGSIYILFNNPTFISRRLPDGSLDSSYGLNGYSNSVSFNDGYAALQTDGKIVIAGAGFAIARLKANGTPDSTFGNNSMQTGFDINSLASAVAIQSDGKIVVAGTYVTNSGNYFALARYNTNGDPDNTFNDSGKVITDFGFKRPPEQGETDSVEVHDQSIKAIAIQADGKIVAGGYAANGFDVDFALARYNLNGLPDSTFNSNGRQTTNFGFADIGNSLAIGNDGKIVLGGYLSDGTNNSVGVIRYNTNGSPDGSFNSNGKQTAVLNSATQTGVSVAIQGDDKIIVASTTIVAIGNNDFEVIRFNTNGSFDNTFDGDGRLTTDFTSSDDYAVSIALQNDNKILVAGYSYINAPGHTSQHLAISRYNTDGNLDISFADNGKLEGISKQGYTVFNASAIQTDGKIVAAGFSWNGSDYDFAVARYNIDGSPDSTFSSDGLQTTDFGGTDKAVSLAIQPDGKIIIAGNSDDRFAAARYNEDGSPDNTFNGNSPLIYPMGFADNCQSVALQNDGKIVMAGYTFIDANFGSVSFAIARINVNGTPDNTFNGSGKQYTDFGSHSDFASSVAIQSDGKIVVAGRSFINNQNYFSVARYNTDGNPDTTFSHDGKQNSSFGPDDYFAQSLAIQNDGKIVAAGFSESPFSGTTSFAVCRYQANGDLDNTFNGNGFQSTSLGSHSNFGRSVVISNEGKIAVGGTNDNYAIVLYKNDGKPDSTFGNNGILITDLAVGGSSIQNLYFSGNQLYATGDGQFPGEFGVVARYLFPQSGVLPVTLLDFTGALRNKSVLLKWTIATEKNLVAFVIERSADGVGFLPINTIASKGTTTFTRDYSMADDQPLQGINFYRLKMIDIDGKFSYSNIVAVKITTGSKLQIFPNPVQRLLFVEANGSNENAHVQIVDASGRKLKDMRVFLNGVTSFSVDISNLPNGFYNLILHKKEKTEVKTFIKR